MLKRAVRVAALAVLALGLAVTSATAAPMPIEPGVVESKAYAPATGCGCHSQLVDQWSSSMHAKALGDPVFKVKRDEGNAATDGKLGAFCDKCHAPIAAASGELASGSLSPVSAESVTCSFCHLVTGLAPGEPGNTSQLIESDGVRRAQLENPAAPHAAQYSAFHKSAEICGGCHNVNHPVNGMHLEATYAEWKNSPYAKEGIVCQDCHMSRAPGEIGPYTAAAASGAAERPNIYSMTFVGGNVAQGPATLAEKRLKSAATLEMQVPEIVAAGESASLTVTVANTGAGHYLPTGLTEVRQMWLSVFVESDDGKRTEIGEHRFGTVLADAEGKFPVELWEATTIHSDDRIPPRESVTESFTLTMPDGLGRGTVKAALLYQSVPDELAEKAGVENPTTEMASATSVVYASEADRAGGEKPSEPTSSEFNLFLPLMIGIVIAAAAVAAFFVAKSKKA